MLLPPFAHTKLTEGRDLSDRHNLTYKGWTKGSADPRLLPKESHDAGYKPLMPYLRKANSSSNIYDNRFMTMFQHGSLHWSAVAVINPGSVLKVEAGGPPESGLAKLQPFILFFDSLVTSSHNSVWLKADLVEVLLRNFREHYPGRPKLLEESFRMKLTDLPMHLAGNKHLLVPPPCMCLWGLPSPPDPPPSYLPTLWSVQGSVFQS